MLRSLLLYSTKYSKVTETKVIGNLDRNDMSYVPATTVKNGKTLSLANVEWQVTGTALVGEALLPAQYQAVATYSASSSYQAATGYVTTAEYHGVVTSAGIESITHTVVYTGTEIIPEAPEPSGFVAVMAGRPVLILGAVLLLALLAGRIVYLLRFRKNVYVYQPGEKPRDYKVIARFRVDPTSPSINLSDVEPYPTGIVAVELKRPLAKKLLGQEFFVHCKDRAYTYKVLQDRPGDWHEFSLETFQEVQP